MDKPLKKPRGFTLIEIVVALTIMAVIGAGTIPYLKQKVDVARAHKTAEEMKGWLEAGMAYYVANNAWPADANTLVTAGFMAAGNLSTPYDGAYTLAVTGSSLEVAASITKFPEVAQSLLPLATLSGTTVSARIPPPGTESAHVRLLNRYGDNEQNKMFATLDMNANSIAATKSIAFNRQSDNSAGLGTITYPDSTSGLKLATGANDPISLWVNSTQKMWLDSTGMNVAGNASVSGYLTANTAAIAGNISAAMVHPTSVVTLGAACSPNGLIARDTNGKTLACQLGVWASLGGSAFGTMETLDTDTLYQAVKDGFVMVSCRSPATSDSRVYGYAGTDSDLVNNRNSSVRRMSSHIVASNTAGNIASFTMAVKSGEFWKIDRNQDGRCADWYTVYWIPI